jgi:hypothetical protein
VPTDVELTDPRLSVFVPVPHIADEGVCDVCHGPTLQRDENDYWRTCWNCRSVTVAGTRTIVPIALVHTSESQLYASLRDYKSSALPDAVRREHALLLAATLQRFFRRHRPHIEAAAGAAWNAIQVVPSTRAREGQHPLEAVIAMTRLRGELAHFLTSTGEPIGHNEPNAGAFAAGEQAAGRRVLLVDDTFTTGSRVQSAAAALTSAGATVAAAVPIGRVIDTTHPTKQAFWRRQRAIGFDFNTCCLEE